MQTQTFYKISCLQRMSTIRTVVFWNLNPYSLVDLQKRSTATAVWFAKINIYNLKFNLHVTKYKLSNNTRLTHRLFICLNLLLLKPQRLRYVPEGIYSLFLNDRQ
jgi:hypothetical protein